MSIQILLHSSKTMRIPADARAPLGVPQLLPQAAELAQTWRNAPEAEIVSRMKVSAVKASEVAQLFREWSADESLQVPAVDAFVGDIYSGLQVQSWSAEDRAYAHEHLLILSGLYGGLRACDGVLPYRLEMGYKLPDGMSMYEFWGKSIASILPPDTTTLINVSAVEYTKALLPHVDTPVIAPKFLTVSLKTGEPTFVTVHTKIARGAFARWLIQSRIQDPARLIEFSELGYAYDVAMSTSEQPVFICQEFGGIGLSVRLT
jgi:cytoplasmic iron level regulating protein YaaA (DUF328/UPF0246 family)